MRAVKSKNTAPEMIVRGLARRLGYRYRLHRKDLPGTPDLTFPGRSKVVCVHGCFWHGHSCARGARMPATNADYWTTKISRNQRRDAMTLAALQQAGWRVLVIWECETKDKDRLASTLSSFLG